MSTSVKVRVIVSNTIPSENVSRIANGHKHLGFIANYFNSKASSKKKLEGIVVLLKC